MHTFANILNIRAKELYTRNPDNRFKMNTGLLAAKPNFGTAENHFWFLSRSMDSWIGGSLVHNFDTRVRRAQLQLNRNLLLISQSKLFARCVISPDDQIYFKNFFLDRGYWVLI